MQKQFLLGPITWKVTRRNVWNDITNLRTSDSTTLQSINSMHWRPPLQRRRKEILGRISKSMLSNCSEMLILGTYWKTWYSMVSEQTCTIDHKLDKIWWQTFSTVDLVHSSHKWIAAISYFDKHSTSMQTWIVSRLWSCRKSTSGRVLSIFGRHLFLPTSWMCKKQTSVSHSLPQLKSCLSM